MGRFNHFNGGQVPGNNTPDWRKKANQDRQQKESDAFGSPKLVAVLLNAARNLPGQIGISRKPTNLATHLIKATNKMTCPEVPATSKSPGQQGRPCCKCFDESGRPLYALAVQLAIAGSKPSDRYCEKCCDAFAARWLIPSDVRTAAALLTTCSSSEFLPTMTTVGLVTKGILTEGDPGKDRRGRSQGIDKLRAKSAFKAPTDTETKKITTLIAETRGKGGLIEIPSTGAKIKDLIKAIELGCGLNRAVANNANYRYDVRELFTTLLKYCSDVYSLHSEWSHRQHRVITVLSYSIAASSNLNSRPVAFTAKKATFAINSGLHT